MLKSARLDFKDDNTIGIELRLNENNDSDDYGECYSMTAQNLDEAFAKIKDNANKKVEKTEKKKNAVEMIIEKVTK